MCCCCATGPDLNFLLSRACNPKEPQGLLRPNNANPFTQAAPACSEAPVSVCPEATETDGTPHKSETKPGLKNVSTAFRPHYLPKSPASAHSVWNVYGINKNKMVRHQPCGP